MALLRASIFFTTLIHLESILKSMFKIKISKGVLQTIQYFPTLPQFSENHDQTRKVFMTGTDDVLLLPS